VRQSNLQVKSRPRLLRVCATVLSTMYANYDHLCQVGIACAVVRLGDRCAGSLTINLTEMRDYLVNRLKLTV
jgi:hypothetical protein